MADHTLHTVGYTHRDNHSAIVSVKGKGTFKGSVPGDFFPRSASTSDVRAAASDMLRPTQTNMSVTFKPLHHFFSVLSKRPAIRNFNSFLKLIQSIRCFLRNVKRFKKINVVFWWTNYGAYRKIVRFSTLGRLRYQQAQRKCPPRNIVIFGVIHPKRFARGIL